MSDQLLHFTDTHCHMQSAGVMADAEATRPALWAKDLTRTPEAIIAAAREAGVDRYICVGCDLADSEAAVAFASEHEGCYASLGMHPHEACGEAAYLSEVQSRFLALGTHPKVVAIGECGLDYFYNQAPRADQIVMLELQIACAQQLDLPLIFHVREAFNDFWPIFDRLQSAEKPIRGVLHSFTDSETNLAEAVKRGLYIGVNGIATFTKQDAQRAMYRAIPVDRLLLETDAPFLTPTPYRGTINESKYIRVIAEFLADLRSEDLSALAAASTSNADTLFSFT